MIKNNLEPGTYYSLLENFAEDFSVKDCPLFYDEYRKHNFFDVFSEYSYTDLLKINFLRTRRK